MMFENARDLKGLGYVSEYVAAQMAAGRTGCEVLASFGAPVDEDTCQATDVESLSRQVLSWVQRVQDEELSAALVAAAREGRTVEALDLLAAGAPWDSLDARGHSAGSYALRGGNEVLTQALAEAGSACILAEAKQAAAKQGGAAAASEFSGEHSAYVRRNIRTDLNSASNRTAFIIGSR